VVTKSAPEFLRRNFKMSSVVKSLAPSVGKVLGGPVGGLIGTAVGGAIGGGGKGIQRGAPATTTVVPTFDPTAEREARRLFEEGQLGQYQMLSPEERDAISRGATSAMMGSPLRGEAEMAAGQLLGGAGTFLSPAQQVFQRLAAAPATTSTEAFRGALESAISPAVQRATSQFAAAGRLGSGLFGEALGRGISEAAAPTILAAQQADIERQMQAGRGLADIGRLGIGALGTGVQAAPAIGALGFEDVQRELGLRGLLSQEDLMRRQQESRALDEYEQLLKGAQLGEATTGPVFEAPTYSAADDARASIGQELIGYGTRKLGGFLGGLGSQPPQVPAVSFGSGTGIPSISVPTYNEPLIDFSMFGRK